MNWKHFDRQCWALGAETHDQKAALAGIARRTYFRLRKGEASLKLDKLADVASRLKTTPALLVGGRK